MNALREKSANCNWDPKNPDSESLMPPPILSVHIEGKKSLWAYPALWIQGSAARNARKEYNLGGTKYLLRRYLDP